MTSGASWDRIDRYVAISTDTHAGADLLDYKPYLPTQLQDDFDAWARTYVSPFDDWSSPPLGAEQECFGGVLLPAVSPGDPNVAPLFHTRYEPLWALCTALDLTVVQHAGAVVR